VAKGYAQCPGQNYNETFSLVVRLEMIRAILVLVPAKNLRVQQMDAYLNGLLQKWVYMQQPNGFSNGMNHVCCLIKPIYGLKQAR